VSAQGLTVRVGVGLSPFERDDVGAPWFWRRIETLEEVGYDSIWMSETATRPGVAPLPVLAAIAARTEKLKLGTSVLVAPPRAPVMLAKELATVDILSGGRLLPAFGLGLDAPAEVNALGLVKGERVGRLEEAIEIVKALWQGEPVTYAGKYSQLDAITLTPKPVRSKLELWLGGSSPTALRRTGRLADGWLASFVTPEQFAEQSAAIRAAAAEAERSIDEDHYGTVIFGARTQADADSLSELITFVGRAVAPEDVVAVGEDALDVLLRRFREVGATKFVLIPVADDPDAFLRDIKRPVIDPFESER